MYPLTSSAISPSESSSPFRFRSMRSAARIVMKPSLRSRTGRERTLDRRSSMSYDRAAGEPSPRRLSAEPGIHGEADVGELALFMDPPSWIAAGRVCQEERVLAGVIGRGRRRVAPVVRRQHEQITGLEHLQDVRKPPVEVLQAAVEVDRVVPVPPEHVRLDEVDEHKAALDRLQKLDRLRDSLHVRLRRARVVDVAAGEDVPDLPDAVDGVPGVAKVREVVRSRGLEREVVAIRRPLVVAGLADERPGDDAADRVPSGQDLARDATTVVELLERDRLLVGGDLEHGVGRRVDDPLACLLVLLAELLDDLGPRSRLVAE